MPILDNVVFCYTKIASPVKAYQSENTEFTQDCVVSKAQAKAWNKEFPKQKAKEVDNADFEEMFKIPPPFPEQDEQFVIKLKKAHIKNGKVTPDKFRPRVIQKTAEGNIDITFDKLVANGSKGKAAYTVNENSFGNFGQLSSILVEELIEYAGANGAGTEFGSVALKEVPANQAPVQKQEEAMKPKEVKKEVVEDFDSDSIPF